MHHWGGEESYRVPGRPPALGGGRSNEPVELDPDDSIMDLTLGPRDRSEPDLPDAPADGSTESGGDSSEEPTPSDPLPDSYRGLGRVFDVPLPAEHQDYDYTPEPRRSSRLQGIGPENQGLAAEPQNYTPSPTLWDYNPSGPTDSKLRGSLPYYSGYNTEPVSYSIGDILPDYQNIFYSAADQWLEWGQHADLQTGPMVPTWDWIDDQYMYATVGSTDSTHIPLQDLVNSDAPPTRLMTEAALYKDPQTYKQALKMKDRTFWEGAINLEVASIIGNQVYSEIPLSEVPIGRKLLPIRWVFKRKTRKDGTVEKYKARLVVKGFKQIEGEDYFDMFSPTLKYASLRALLALAASLDLDLSHWDVETAFLHSKLNERIFTQIPDGFKTEANKNKCWVLNKALYGLKQAPAEWYKTFTNALKDIGFVRTSSEQCLYVFHRGTEKVLMGVFVDDIAVASNSPRLTEYVREQLRQQFIVHDRGELTDFLGLDIERNRVKRTLFVCQKKYMINCLATFDLMSISPKAEPLPSGCKFSDFGDKNNQPYTGPYREKIGKLLYLSVQTRPDISCAVAKLAQHVNDPRVGHNNLVNHLFGYIQRTMEAGITLGGFINPLECFCDAAHANNDDIKSITGYVVMLGKCPIIWSSKKQPLVTKSTVESEIEGLYSATPNCMWLQDLMKEIAPETLIGGPVPIWEDNQGTIDHLKKENLSMRTMHFRRRYKWVCQAQQLGDILVDFVPGVDQTADVLTKLLPQVLHEKHCAKLITLADGSDPFAKPCPGICSMAQEIELEENPIQWS